MADTAINAGETEETVIKAADHDSTSDPNGSSSGGKWTGGVVEFVLDCRVEAAWELISDWGNWQRWWSENPTFEVREGENRKPGCLRYVFLSPGPAGWYYERLVESDEENHSMTYTMEENEMVPGGYKGLMGKVLLRATEDIRKTMVDYTYEVEPVENQTSEGFALYVTTLYKSLLNDLEKAAQRLAAGLPLKPDETLALDEDIAVGQDPNPDQLTPVSKKSVATTTTQKP